MTNKNEVYRCEICGNIVTVLHESFGELVCCGKPMTKLNEQTSDDSMGEKHVPVADNISENLIEIKIGAIPHPMQEEHYIEFIQILSDDEVRIKYLVPGQEAKYITNFDEDFIAREYCNIHGLWSNKK